MSSLSKLFLFTSILLSSGPLSMAQDCVNNPTYADPPPAAYFNTGTDGAGGQLPGGSNDLHWQYSLTGNVGSYVPAIVMGPVPGAYYTSPWPDCQWISHSADGIHNTNYDIYYKFSFTLACFNNCHQSFSTPGVFCLGLDFFADNSVYEILVNGVVQVIPGIPVGDPYNYVGFQQAQMVSVSLCNNWQPGNNDLIIHVKSGPNYEGFLAQASVNTPVPPNDTIHEEICQGDQYIFGPNTYTTAGTYTHTFTNQTGCDSTVTLVLGVNPVYDNQASSAICYGDSLLFGGTYYHNSGTYTHTFSTAKGCDSVVHMALTVNRPQMAATKTNLSCYNDASGTITVNAAGSPPGYTFALNANPYTAANSFSGLAAGTYTLHTKDANACVRDTIITITEPTELKVTTVAIVTPACNDAHGTFTVTATGGTTAYTYAIDAGAYQASNVLAGLAIGTYVVHIKDANGCIKDTTVEMAGPPVVSSTVTITPEPCHGQSLGGIDVTGTGGVAPYTYALDAGAYTGTGSYTGLIAGSYTLHIKDANACVQDTVVYVTEPPSLGSTLNVVAPTCYDSLNGSIVITPNGGTPPFTYAMNNGPFTGVNIFTSLGAIIANLHIVDDNGCTIDTTVILQAPGKLNVTDLLITNVRCAGGNDGVVQVYGIGGTLPYTYTIDGGAYLPGNTMAAQMAGTHVVHVKDAHGCITDTTVEVGQPQPLSFSDLGAVNASCEGFKDGAVSLQGAGGTAPYTYSNDGSHYNTKGVYAALPQGTYTYYIKDSNGCKADTAVMITEGPHIVISDPILGGVSCYNMHDGAITVNAAGGVDPLKYAVDGSAATSSNTFTGLAGGAHTVLVTDNAGCEKRSTVTVPEPGELSLQMFSNGNLCEGVDNNGAVYVKVKGGTAPFRYMWSTDPGKEIYKNGINGLPNGDYAVTVKDARNCTAWGATTVQYDNCCKPYVANAFTPNNDGRNDIFRPVYKGDMTLIKMVIYNRYGQEIFTTNNTNEGWDGTYHGVPQDMGTYYFYIEIYCSGDNSHKQGIKGDVSLIR